MLALRSFINFFFVPVIGLCLFLKKEHEETILIPQNISPNLQLLIRYCMFVVFNIPFTRVITFFIRIFIGKNIEADDSYYTITAIVATVLIPYVYDYFASRKQKKVEMQKKSNIEENSDVENKSTEC